MPVGLGRSSLSLCGSLGLLVTMSPLPFTVLFASFLSLAKCLSILLIFSRNQLLVLLNFLLFFYS